MQGAARTGAERTGSYVSTGSAAATQQMAVHGQAPRAMNRLIEKANILVEALPYIRAFAGKTLVIKYGGKAQVDDALKAGFAEDVVLMKYIGLNPVIVHGGGPQISDMMKRLGKEPRFVDGVRVTDRETMEIVEMVLGGVINKEIVELISRHGGRAVGVSGKDGRLITAKRVKASGGKRVDLGQVGDVEAIDPQMLVDLTFEPLHPGDRADRRRPRRRHLQHQRRSGGGRGRARGEGRKARGAHRRGGHPGRQGGARPHARAQGHPAPDQERHDHVRDAAQGPGLPDRGGGRRGEGAHH